MIPSVLVRLRPPPSLRCCIVALQMLHEHATRPARVHVWVLAVQTEHV